MRKRHLAVGLLMLVAGAVSYELVRLTEASPAVAAVGPAPSTLGIHAAAKPMVLLAKRAPAGASRSDSISDAALFASTGVALFILAAGVRRRAR